MDFKEKLINLTVIGCIVILPHTELIPNFLYSIPVLLLVWLSLKYGGKTFIDIGFAWKRFEFKSIFIGILVASLTLIFMQWIFFPLLEQFVTFEEPKVELYDFLKENKGQYIFILIMGILIGGIYEEIVFHGFMFYSFEKIFKGKNATLYSFLCTALLFGLYHIQLGMNGLINASIVGVIYLGLFLSFKRNLWYSICCHGVYNTIVITLIYKGYLQ